MMLFPLWLFKLLVLILEDGSPSFDLDEFDLPLTLIRSESAYVIFNIGTLITLQILFREKLLISG